MSVIDDIAAERQRQLSVEGWTLDHDDCHHVGEMARAAERWLHQRETIQSIQVAPSQE